jgi:exopolysaccharide production protein ExoQ
MPPPLATLLCICGILGLFVFDYDRKVRTSRALWIPVIWFWIIGSREVSVWIATFSSGYQLDASLDANSLDGNPLDRNVYLVLLLLGFVVLSRRWPRVRRILRANLPILLFFGYCAISVLWSDYPDIAFKRWIKSVGDIIMVLVIVSDPNRLAAMRSVLARATFILIPLSVLLIKYYPSVGKAFKHYGMAIYVGVTTNKNLLGIICLLFGLATVWRLVSAYQDRNLRDRNRRLIAHGAVFALVLWLFSMAHSTTSLACFILVSPLLIATGFRSFLRRPTIIHLSVAAIILVSFSVLFLGIGGDALQGMGKDATLTGRTDIWRLVLGLTGNSWIGAGFESFWLPGWRRDKIWDAYWWHPNEAHNGYIEVFLNLGWLGVALLVLILLSGYRNIMLSLRRDGEIGRLSLAYFVVSVVYSFTEAGFRMLDPVWLTFLMAIMAISTTRASKAAKSEVETSPFRLRDPQVQVNAAFPGTAQL